MEACFEALVAQGIVHAYVDAKLAVGNGGLQES